ncbi:MAG TPA: hypothetical protein VMK66_11850 [Myxococcales bacterium]|nr:hypothetical protein [Myxococcales bacterium]
MPQTLIRGVIALFTFLPAVAYASIPIAHCRAGDKTESGLQGLTTPAEIAAGKQNAGFNCNVDLVGQYQGEGASWQLTAWKNCAYFDQRLNAAEAHPGTVAVDVSDPAHPTPTQWLSDNAMLDPWESLKVNPARQLLAAGQRPSTGFSIYDISADCKHPVQKSFINIPGMFGHTGQWAPDGMTYYVTPLRTDQTIIAIDTRDPAAPVVIPCAAGSYGCGANGFFTAPAADFGTARWHDLEFSKDGNTAYISMLATGDPAIGNGLVILDVSDFNQKKANPAYRVISQLTWDDGSVGAQNALFINIKGKPYILFTDESGGPLSGCAKGKSAAGFARIIDIADPKNPKTVAKLIDDIHDPANCQVAATTPVSNPNGNPTTSGPFGFSCHYCNVDDADDAKVAACACFAAGWRFYDISDVNYVREIAYWKPPAQGLKVLPASQYANTAPATYYRNFDWSTSKASFPKDRGMTTGDVWITSQDNGFMVVKLDPNATAAIGGGCASVDASVGALLVFGLVQVIRRRKAKSA